MTYEDTHPLFENGKIKLLSSPYKFNGKRLKGGVAPVLILYSVGLSLRNIMAIQSQNPATSEMIKTFTPHTDAQVDLAISKADAAQHELREWSFTRRSKAMMKMARILETEAEELAKIITMEMGKPYLQAIGEVKKCAWVCRYYAEHAEAHLEPEFIKTEASESYRAFLLWRLCLGISRSGRFFVLLRRPSWRAIRHC